jgi:2-C-methyl-D-erythritol 4-phosphate cytidylyltransferase/2-C-methyl-D-erythritol 2,4-cyclodiphosphate synthase
MAIAIILAAGKSTRFGKKDKLLMPVLGKPVLYYALQTIHDHPQVRQVILVVNAGNKKAASLIVKKYHFPKIAKIVIGGNQRQQSLEKGLMAIKGANHDEIILVHNGANPLVTEKEISLTINAAKKSGAAAVGKKVSDTIKEIKNGHWVKTHDRDKMIAAQTPQAVHYGLLKKALIKAEKTKTIFTDESSLVEILGLTTKHIQAAAENIKITTAHDYERLKLILGDSPKNFLVGLGQDSHEFTGRGAQAGGRRQQELLVNRTCWSTGLVGQQDLSVNRTYRSTGLVGQQGLWLGGICFKKYPKLRADSDGDVILHALYNAISQALSEGSLGRFATPLLKEKGISDSKKYLANLLKKVAARGYRLNNIGLMIEAKKPKIDPLVAQIKKSLGAITKLPERRIGITATSGDNLTSFGRGEGIQCFAIVSLIK